jgi:hypothetical protein
MRQLVDGARVGYLAIWQLQRAAGARGIGTVYSRDRYRVDAQYDGAADFGRTTASPISPPTTGEWCRPQPAASSRWR